ncbi:hypothetical protein WN944_006705 [Citrus x changshan-huyou]|uniref:Uncharacterized protein n=1 Tax=Citrus x changshan-huyou TaxID=2935761 RepID=A0AAP0MJL7_9ROSI
MEQLSIYPYPLEEIACLAPPQKMTSGKEMEESRDLISLSTTGDSRHEGKVLGQQPCCIWKWLTEQIGHFRPALAIQTKYLHSEELSF